MTDGQHVSDGLEGPAADLLGAAAAAVPGWLSGCVERIARSQSIPVGDWAADVEAMVERSSAQVLDRLGVLLATDVDEQRSNPLDILRDAVAGPTEVLLGAGARPVSRDTFSEERFPGDLFDLAPATWADVDESMVEPGLTWGAWKAAVVLTRRRGEGLR